MVSTHELLRRFIDEMSTKIEKGDLLEFASCIDECISSMEKLRTFKDMIGDATSYEQILQELPVASIELAHIHWHIEQVKFLRDQLRAF